MLTVVFIIIIMLSMVKLSVVKLSIFMLNIFLLSVLFFIVILDVIIRPCLCSVTFYCYTECTFSFRQCLLNCYIIALSVVMLNVIIQNAFYVECPF
jgi:hypothetical protein